LARGGGRHEKTSKLEQEKREPFCAVKKKVERKKKTEVVGPEGRKGIKRRAKWEAIEVPEAKKKAISEGMDENAEQSGKQNKASRKEANSQKSERGCEIQRLGK